MDVFINSLSRILHNVNVYQTTTVYNLNILQFYLSTDFNKACGGEEKIWYLGENDILFFTTQILISPPLPGNTFIHSFNN